MTPHPDFIREFTARRGPRSFTAEQFVARFNERCVPAEGGHILWDGTKTLYGTVYYGSVSLAGRNLGAHRVAYWMATGIEPSPDMEIDHVCKVTLCVNPDHLEQVTQYENNRRSDSATALNARKTHCLRGHEFNEANTRISRDGKGRYCRACDRIRFMKRSGR